MQKLTPKQATFVREYLLDLNATQAAIRAGYSKNRASEIGYQLLQKTTVQSAIQEAQEARSKRTEITADRVLQELARIGFSSPKRIFTEQGTLAAITDLDDDIAAAISSVEIVCQQGQENEERPIYTKKVRFWDKKGSLELLGKHMGLFDGKVGDGEEGDKPLPWHD